MYSTSEETENLANSLEAQPEQPFDYEKQCLFCTQDASEEFIQTIIKNGAKRKNNVSIVSKMTTIDRIICICMDNLNPQNEKLKERVLNKDLVALNARYHRNCFCLFMVKKRTTSAKRGRPKDKGIESQMLTVCEYVDNNIDFGQITLENIMQVFDLDFNLRTLTRKLIDHYGGNILIDSGKISKVTRQEENDDGRCSPYHDGNDLQHHDDDIVSNCHGCLSSDRTVSPLGLYEELFCKITSLDSCIRMSEVRLCWECMGVLRKVNRFKERVLKAQENLADFNNQNLDKGLSTFRIVEVYNDTLLDENPDLKTENSVEKSSETLLNSEKYASSNDKLPYQLEVEPNSFDVDVKDSKEMKMELGYDDVGCHNDFGGNNDTGNDDFGGNNDSGNDDFDGNNDSVNKDFSDDDSVEENYKNDDETTDALPKLRERIKRINYTNKPEMAQPVVKSKRLRRKKGPSIMRLRRAEKQNKMLLIQKQKEETKRQKQMDWESKHHKLSHKRDHSMSLRKRSMDNESMGSEDESENESLLNDSNESASINNDSMQTESKTNVIKKESIHNESMCIDTMQNESENEFMKEPKRDEFDNESMHTESRHNEFNNESVDTESKLNEFDNKSQNESHKHSENESTHEESKPVESLRIRTKRDESMNKSKFRNDSKSDSESSSDYIESLTKYKRVRDPDFVPYDESPKKRSKMVTNEEESKKRSKKVANKEESDQTKPKCYTILEKQDTGLQGCLIKWQKVTEDEIQEWLERDREWYAGLRRRGIKHCELCLTVVRKPDTMEGHMKRHSAPQNTESFICDKCKLCFDSVSELEKHKERHLLIRSCVVCGMRCQSYDRINEHVSNIHKPLVKCNYCEDTFGTFRLFREHFVGTHKRGFCDQCGWRGRRDALDKHIFKKHTTHKCQYCDKSFIGTYKLHCHVQRNHPIDARANEFYCVTCDKYFVTDFKLQSHLKYNRVHKLERGEEVEYKCKECPNVYRNNYSLIKHIKFVHKNEKEFKCVPCNKVYARKPGLDYHNRSVHLGLKPEKDKFCQYCGRGFSNTRVLIHHIRTHTGEKPYECTECDAKFAQKTAMTSHMKHIHLKLKRKESTAGAGSGDREESHHDSYNMFLQNYQY